MTKSFTLIEIIISVLLFSLTVLAVFTLQKNSLHLLDGFERNMNKKWLLSLVSSDNKLGLESKNKYLDDLLKDYKVEDGLRQEFKKYKLVYKYKELQKRKFSGDDTDGASQELKFIIGETSVSIKDKAYLSYIRLGVE